MQSPISLNSLQIEPIPFKPTKTKTFKNILVIIAVWLVSGCLVNKK